MIMMHSPERKSVGTVEHHESEGKPKCHGGVFAARSGPPVVQRCHVPIARQASSKASFKDQETAVYSIKHALHVHKKNEKSTLRLVPEP